MVLEHHGGALGVKPVVGRAAWLGCERLIDKGLVSGFGESLCPAWKLLESIDENLGVRRRTVNFFGTYVINPGFGVILPLHYLTPVTYVKGRRIIKQAKAGRSPHRF